MKLTHRILPLLPLLPLLLLFAAAPATATAFAKGHRIRVEISSSYFPLYLRNLNTGADNIGLETTSVVATQKVMHTTEQASRIVLPVIPRTQT
jgi:predicted acyl esterase